MITANVDEQVQNYHKKRLKTAHQLFRSQVSVSRVFEAALIIKQASIPNLHVTSCQHVFLETLSEDFTVASGI